MTNRREIKKYKEFEVVLSLDNENAYGFNYKRGREWESLLRITTSKVPGLKEGDVILSINKLDVADLRFLTIREEIKKAKGRRENLHLRIKRAVNNWDNNMEDQEMNTVHQTSQQKCTENQPKESNPKIVDHRDGQKCTQHLHWKICCRLSNGKELCHECLNDETSPQLLLHDTDIDFTDIQKFVRSKITDHRIPLYHIGISKPRREEYCEKHINWEIFGELPCGKKLCFMCAVDAKENKSGMYDKFTEDDSQSIYIKCICCGNNVLHKTYVEKIKIALQTADFRSTLLKPLKSEKKEPCKVHKHLSMNYQLHCCKRVCFRCLAEKCHQNSTITKTVLNSACDLTLCPSCSQTFPVQNLVKLLSYKHDQIHLECMPVKPIINGNACEKHKHWKSTIRLPCSGEICSWCLVDIQEYIWTSHKFILNRHCKVTECISCNEYIPVDCFDEQIKQILQEIQPEHMPVKPIINGNACKRHKHWKSTIILPCSGELCSLCLMNMQEYTTASKVIWGSRYELKMCVSCLEYIPVEHFNEQMKQILQEIQLEHMTIKSIISGNSCEIHKYLRSTVLLPCSTEVCMFCLAEMQQCQPQRRYILNKSCEMIMCISCLEDIPLDNFNQQINTFARHALQKWCLQYKQCDRDCNWHGKCTYIRDSECLEWSCLMCLKTIEKTLKIGDTRIQLGRCQYCNFYIPIEQVVDKIETITRRSVPSMEKEDRKPVDRNDNKMTVTRNKHTQEVSVQITKNKDTKLVDKDDDKMVVTYSKSTQEVADPITETNDADKTNMHDDKMVEKKLNDDGRAASTQKRQNENKKSSVAMAASITRKEDDVNKDEFDVPKEALCCKCRYREESTYLLRCGHEYCVGCLCSLENFGEDGKQCEICQYVTKLNDYGTTTQNQRSYTEKTSEIGGLWNVGATCYANCILQILGQTPSLVKLLKIYTSTMKKGNAASLLLQILLDINSKRYQASTNDLNKLMGKVFKNDHSFRLFRQNDCHSFILSLFDLIEHEETTTKSAGSAYQCKTSQPASIFQGYMKNQFTFNTCEHTDSTEEQMFFSILVPVRKTKEQKWSVERGIESLLEIETFDDNDLPCRKCLNLDKNEADVSRTSTKKQLLIAKAPDILVLQLARFTEIEQNGNIYLSKNYQDVEFKDTLKLKTEGTVEETYELYGVVMHAGSLAGGHYSSYVKKLSESSSPKWFYCSDSFVMKSDWNAVRSYGQEYAYLLFYTRQNSN